jgi:chemotaxis protein histidine kinase CheA
VSDIDEQIEETLERAGKIFTEVGTLPGLLSAADKLLSEKLQGVLAKAGGPTAKFSEATALLTQKQIRLVQDYVGKRLLGLTHEESKKAIKVGVKDTAKLAKNLEKRFAGITKPLQLEEQAWQDHTIRGTGASLLRKHQSSVDRYGKRMIADFERQIRLGFLTGMSNEELVSRLVETGKAGKVTAKGLHKQKPGSFPEPTSYVKRRYWAERIVRTEKAYAYNAASLRSIQVLKQTDFPDMQKKILAHFDNRTAPDSVAVHGQVRPVDGLFRDGAGREYLHPPGRPNDRETVVPWRPHWEDTPATKSSDATELALQAAAKPAPLVPGPEASPNALFDDIMATNAKVKAKKAAEKATEQKQEAVAVVAKVTAAEQTGKVKAAKAAEKALAVKAKKLQLAAAKKAVVEQLKNAKLIEAATKKAAKVQAQAQAKALKAKKIADAKQAKAQAKSDAAKLKSEAKALKGNPILALERAERFWAEKRDGHALLAQLPDYERGQELDTRNWEGKTVSSLAIRKRSDALSANMTIEQRWAVKSFSGSGYIPIREAERNGEPSAASEAIQTAIKEHGMPEKGLRVWRGLSVPVSSIGQWLQGEPFMLGHDGNEGTASTSRSQAKSAGFAGLTMKDGYVIGDGYGDQVKVLLRLKNTRGVAIETISHFEEEREILQPKNARFRTTGVFKMKGKKAVIVVEAEGLED